VRAALQNADYKVVNVARSQVFLGDPLSPMRHSLIATAVQTSGGSGSVISHGASPNPFNGRVTISYSIDHEAQVKVSIYTLSGRKVIDLFAGGESAGLHARTWDGCDASGSTVASGVYIYRISTSSRTLTGKFAMVK
jgi:flagellar hook assembly protein FlgD